MQEMWSRGAPQRSFLATLCTDPTTKYLCCRHPPGIHSLSIWLPVTALSSLHLEPLLGRGAGRISGARPSAPASCPWKTAFHLLMLVQSLPHPTLVSDTGTSTHVKLAGPPGRRMLCPTLNPHFIHGHEQTLESRGSRGSRGGVPGY